MNCFQTSPNYHPSLKKTPIDFGFEMSKVKVTGDRIVYKFAPVFL